MSAPERIWAWHERTPMLDARLWEAMQDAPSYFPGTEYHRSDLTEARIAAAVKAALGEAAGLDVDTRELRHCIRALADDPTAIARIVKGV